MSVSPVTWEGAVEWLRSQPDRQELVRDCYFDDPIVEAAERFRQSEEWQAVSALVKTSRPSRVLDLGAGRGISTYCFAANGCAVTAVEPNPSLLVGRRAIANLLQQSGQSAEIIAATGEYLPLRNGAFDMVYGRAVLHHAQDLERLCREASRVLRTGGVFLATREHVLSDPQDLGEFLARHPLHALYGGENAYVLERYLGAIRGAGLRIAKIMGPFDTPINYSPLTRRQMLDLLRRRLACIVGKRLASVLVARDRVARHGARVLSSICRIPGQHYSFLAYKR